MNEKQIDRFLAAFEILSCGVDKLGDGVKSISNYLWFPLYVILFVIMTLAILYLFSLLS